MKLKFLKMNLEAKILYNVYFCALLLFLPWGMRLKNVIKINKTNTFV